MLWLCLSFAPVRGATSARDSIAVELNQPSTSAKTTAENLNSGDKALRETCAFYRRLNAFSFRVTADLHVKSDDKVTDKIDVADLEFGRLPYLRVKMLQPKQAGEAIINGSAVSFYKPQWRVYSARNISPLKDVFKDQDFAYISDGALKAALIDVFTADDPYAELMKDRILKAYNGLTVVDGINCHHLTLTRKGASCDENLYLCSGKEPWVKLFRPEENCPLVTLPLSAAAPKTEMTRTFSYRFLKRAHVRARNRLNRKYMEVSQLVFASANDARQTLVGKPAPRFRVGTIDGGTFDLSRRKGHITIIEFWASWCSPCCRALPVIDEVSRSFSDKGVQFVALNQKEEQSVIKSFLERGSLTAKVGLDTDGKVASSYHVVGLPQTVVVGSNGKVVSVHVGCPADLREQLTKDLTVAGNLSH